MCGVIGLIFQTPRNDLGQIAAELLKTLEYRGYDSTGAAVQGNNPNNITLVKGVGAPSAMVHQLGIVDLQGKIFCGQVRWATFGAVDDKNSQPHLVHCKTTIYGAHNGNVTNCDELKVWLTAEGHKVMSDNDGEMVVHTVEHFFAIELANCDDASRNDTETRKACMRRAVGRAWQRLRGSFTAVIIDPISGWAVAIKGGSSLYFGLGHDDIGGKFCIASSDLSSILKLTRALVAVTDGEMVEYGPGSYTVYQLPKRGLSTAQEPECKPIERHAVRSRLRAKDTGLVPPFETFMDQEITAQTQTCRDVITMFLGGSQAAQTLTPFVHSLDHALLATIQSNMDQLLDQCEEPATQNSFHALADSDAMSALLSSIPDKTKSDLVDGSIVTIADQLASAEAGFLADLLHHRRNEKDVLVLRLLDAIVEMGEIKEFTNAIDEFLSITTTCLKHGGRIYVVCCGSSFHAAKAACLFFNETALTEIIPIIPGEFRGQYSRSLRDGDMFIAVSQSGETKDLIDVLNLIISSGRDIKRVALVNNVNSTLAQEKCHMVIPLRCGPEIAVPATKSFINQLTTFYCLALKLAERRLAENTVPESERAQLEEDTALRIEKLPLLPKLIRNTISMTEEEVTTAARMLYLCPSMHILATRITAVAKEGALKVREVVLNHTEGVEGSEFKHGPNTILGFNTVWGPSQVDSLLRELGRGLEAMVQQATLHGMRASAAWRLVQAATDAVFYPADPFSLTPEELKVFERFVDRDAMVNKLYADYPLVYVTGPDETDVQLTISQINTHKIRGSSTVVIAEDNLNLRGAATKAPSDNPDYRSVYITLPRTNDTLTTVFSATVVLQRLALKMSLLKKNYLDKLGIMDHGVHPDVPKNVSKSITVD
ncbi:MAG: SIS domain-containing protein [Polyangiaceae bacterium]|nr:SIS domain-containing protein [Polyangiaceae bacterium]